MSVQRAAEPISGVLDERWAAAIAEIERATFPTPWTESLVREELKKDHAFAYGVTFGDTLISYALTNLIIDELHILTLAVHPDFRSQGQGSRLVEHLLQEARSRGVRSAFLEVRRGNVVAQRLYERFGFCFIGIRKEYYSDNREDAFVLKRLIS